MKVRVVYDKRPDGRVQWWLETEEGLKVDGGTAFSSEKAKEVARGRVAQFGRRWETQRFHGVCATWNKEGDE